MLDDSGLHNRTQARGPQATRQVLVTRIARQGVVPNGHARSDSELQGGVTQSGNLTF